MKRHTAIIQRSMPFSGNNALEAIEMLMALGNYELPAALFFMDDGVFQLSPDINVEGTQQKSPLKLLGALKFYDIEDIYVCRESLNLRNINISALPDFLKLYENQDLRDKMNNYQQIIQF